MTYNLCELHNSFVCTYACYVEVQTYFLCNLMLESFKLQAYIFLLDRWQWQMHAFDLMRCAMDIEIFYTMDFYCYFMAHNMSF